MIRVGAKVAPDWFDRPDDLRFLKQVGVDYVNTYLSVVPGYNEAGGRASREGFQQVVDMLDEIGLKLWFPNTHWYHFNKTWFGQPGYEQEIENAQINAELCGEFGVPLMGIQVYAAAGREHYWVGHRDEVDGRGGYKLSRFKLSSMIDAPTDPDGPDREGLWERTIELYRAVVPVAESTGVKIATHGTDPPVPSLLGRPQVMINFAEFEHLFSEVPNANNGMNFCVGTRYESGEDIFDGIKRFGAGGRIFHGHFRNVRGRIPEGRTYQEAAPDDGDLDMFRVAKALNDSGFDGVIDYDHIRRLVTDGPAGREYIAFCIGHMRGIVQSLESMSKEPA